MPIIRKAVETALKLKDMDKRAWDSLYFGIRKDIAKGIQHGFGAGSIVGTFINDDENPFEDAQIFPPGRKLSKTYKFSKKYSRRSLPRRCRCNKYRRYSY